MTAAFEGLRRIPGPVGVLSATCLALGLSAKDSEVRRQAIEWFAEASPGRVPVAELVSAMALVAPAVQCHRWAAALGEAAAISPTTATAVREWGCPVCCPPWTAGSAGLAT